MIGGRKVRQVMSDMRMVCNEAQRIWSDLGAVSISWVRR